MFVMMLKSLVKFQEIWLNAFIANIWSRCLYGYARRVLMC